MGRAFRLRRVGETASRFWSNIPGRTFRNPPHPETATHYSAKNWVAFSQALDVMPVQGVSPTATQLPHKPAKGTSLFWQRQRKPARASKVP